MMPKPLPDTPEPNGEIEQGKRRLPRWFRVPAPGNERYREIQALLRREHLHTVCEGAHCPNIGECWGIHGTATFMILGNCCTRRCRFCAVEKGTPSPPDISEADSVARAVQTLGLRHVVVTSVTRDDLPDGGASTFAEVIHRIRDANQDVTIEVLIPDFRGDVESLKVVLEARPDVLNHNLETVRRLYAAARPQSDYERSLSVLRHASKQGCVTKTGIMVGLGERWDELEELFADAARAGCSMMTIGQYLRPSEHHLPIDRFYTPDEFAMLRSSAEKAGVSHVESGPLVRSSYHAAQQVNHATRER